MTDILNLLKTLSPHDWGTILTFLASGTGVAVVLQAIKHFGKLEDAKKLVMILLGILSFVASFTDWYIQYSGQNPKTVVLAHLGWIVTAAVFVHRFIVSPSYYKLVDFLKSIAEVKEYKAEQAAQPITPVSQLDATLAAATPQEFTLAN